MRRFSETARSALHWGVVGDCLECLERDTKQRCISVLVLPKKDMESKRWRNWMEDQGLLTGVADRGGLCVMCLRSSLTQRGNNHDGILESQEQQLPTPPFFSLASSHSKRSLPLASRHTDCRRAAARSPSSNLARKSRNCAVLVARRDARLFVILLHIQCLLDSLKAGHGSSRFT